MMASIIKAVFFILMVLGVAMIAIGYYVLMHKDTSHAFVKPWNNKRTHGGLSGDVMHTPSDFRASEVTSGNGTESKRRHFQQNGDDVEKIDTNKEFEGMGIEKYTTDLDSADPQELMNRTVIVTAISQNHLEESKGMIGSVQKCLPNTRIIVYDLGLNPDGVQEVKRLCNVELRYFNFSKYPPHVKNLYKYAWKPLIIRDALEEFGVVFWCDASARFKRDPLVLFSILKEQSGFAIFVEEYNSTHMIIRTHPEMFKWFGINVEKFDKDDGYAMCFEANRILFVNTALIQTKIIVPWVNCALEEKCISPKGSALKQHLSGPKRYTHRFDQAALALIVYKNLRGLLRKENDRSNLFGDVVGLKRFPAGSKKAKFCKS